MKWYKYIAPVPGVQIFTLFFTKRTHCFLKCAQCWILGWEKQVSSGTSWFWTKSYNEAMKASSCWFPHRGSKCWQNASLRVSLPLHLYTSFILPGWLCRRGVVLLGRKKEKTDVGRATCNACNRCLGRAIQGQVTTHWPTTVSPKTDPSKKTAALVTPASEEVVKVIWPPKRGNCTWKKKQILY